MPVTLDWNKTFTNDDAYGDAIIPITQMFSDAMMERLKVIGACGAGFIGEGVRAGRANSVFDYTYFANFGGAQIENDDDPDNTIAVSSPFADQAAISRLPFTHDALDQQYSQVPQYPLDYGNPLINPSSWDDASTFGIPFTWVNLQYLAWKIRAFFITQGAKPSTVDSKGLLKVVPWPSPNGFTRQYTRQIHRIDVPGNAGDKAKFVVWKMNDGIPNSISYPVPITSPTPTDQYENALKIYSNDGTNWTPATGANPKADRVTKQGLGRGGDLFGPWIMNDVRDCLNLCTQTWGTGGFFNGIGGSGAVATQDLVSPLPQFDRQNQLYPSFLITGYLPDQNGTAANIAVMLASQRGNGIARQIDYYVSPAGAPFDAEPTFFGTETVDRIVTQFIPNLSFFDFAPSVLNSTPGIFLGDARSPLLPTARWAVCRFDVSGGFQYTKATKPVTLNP